MLMVPGQVVEEDCLATAAEAVQADVVRNLQPEDSGNLVSLVTCHKETSLAHS